MNLIFLLSSLFAAVQAQSSIGAPSPGAVLLPGHGVTVQFIVPIDTSVEAGQQEISLIIGMVACPSGCPAPSADLGEILFVGKYQSQGTIGNTLNSFQNFDLTVPGDISGLASIQIQHSFLLTPPQHALPNIEYRSLPVQVGIASSPSTLNIHPNGDNTKCVDIVGGVFADGTAVDIYDCNGTNAQKWKWNGNALMSVNPADKSQWCLDAGVQSLWTTGVHMKIWQCFSNLPQQAWTPVTTSGNIQLTTANLCLDLTNGAKTNGNPLQLWTCGGGNPNQIWTVTSA